MLNFDIFNFNLKARNEREAQFLTELKEVHTGPRRGENIMVGYQGAFDFRLGIEGIRKFFKSKRIYINNGKRKLEVDTLEPGEFIALINRDQNAVKLVGRSNLVTYQRMPQGQKVHPAAIALIPRYFNGKELDLGKACEEAIRADFAKYMQKRSPVRDDVH